MWKAITKLPNASQYIECVESWTDFVLRCFGHRELNTVLGDIIKVLFQIAFTVQCNVCSYQDTSVLVGSFSVLARTDRLTDWLHMRTDTDNN